MSSFFDDLETRSADQRASDLARDLPQQIARAKNSAPALSEALAGVVPGTIRTRADLAPLPVIRKSTLSEAQKKTPPFGGYTTRPANGFEHVFQSPGPIYEPARTSEDWWRLGRALKACGIGPDDIVQNCFSYHMTPAGMIFENAARAVGATIFPAGTGQTDLQVQAAAALGVTAYAGTPDYLKVILDRADALGVDLSTIRRAAVGGGALFPSLRAEYAARGVMCLQSYATADLGGIAYESEAQDGMIIDEGVIVEIVTPGTNDPLPDGEVGEVVVTTLNPDYPLIRFATGDLSAIMAGTSPCGRTNMRIRGWLGRADQTTKIKGMFVRPEQVAAFVAANENVAKARVIATRADEKDVLTINVEADGGDQDALAASVLATLKLRGTVVIVPVGSLPNDGKVIDDQRSYE